MSLLQEFQNFAHSEWKGMKPGLERILKACESFDHPELKFPSIHIAGTNGKGSVAAMLHSILSEAGLKVGLFTSPHLIRVNERFRVGDQEITDEKLERILEKIFMKIPLFTKEEREALTFFELCTLIAFLYFAEEKVDVAVLETGLGGRLDATNVVKPLVSVITEISLDHAEILGTHLTAIAGEKAGIVKPQVPVVCGATALEAVSAIRRVAKEKEAPFFSLSSPPDSTLGLSGAHQRHNAAIALTTVQVLGRDVGWNRPSPLTRPISDSALRRGLEKVRWPGRLEWVSLKPPILLDGAHNLQGVRALAGYLKEKKEVGWKILFSASKDKDVEGMLKILRDVSHEITICSIASPRSIDPKVFSGNPSVRTADAAFEAYQKILKGLQPKEGLVVTGSLYLVGEIKKSLNAGLR